MRHIGKKQLMDELLQQKLKDPMPKEYFGKMQFVNVKVNTFKEKVWIPEDLQLRLIGWYHKTLGHVGSTRTIKSISQTFGFPGLRLRVEDLIWSCNTRQCHKRDQKRRLMESFLLSQHWVMNAIGMHTYQFNWTLDSYNQGSCHNAGVQDGNPPTHYG
jgi:hypothetical protein